jgi:hypothetical protein
MLYSPVRQESNHSFSRSHELSSIWSSFCLSLLHLQSMASLLLFNFTYFHCLYPSYGTNLMCYSYKYWQATVLALFLKQHFVKCMYKGCSKVLKLRMQSLSLTSCDGHMMIGHDSLNCLNSIAVFCSVTVCFVVM